ncbi:coxsackievirus and adenovirus receptor homolog [Sander lucioperca]|uniref:coxsackievirus and adenovirus receptor homolog n=1 Tax=Sander lucioperca TaxID=283035 RepID=UPI0016538F71|nr:coxsackievirus and adenovirus receptor homolog [Sander lucioperca]
MAPVLFLLLFLSGAASDLIEVTVNPGDDVILPCQADDSSIRAVKWSRPDLEPDIVLYCSDGHLDPTCQHPSFKDRVELVDRDLKDGDVSLTLKNVSSIDNGTYECGVASGSSRRKKRSCDPISTIRLIRTVYLQVPDPELVVAVRPGQDVTLQCQATKSNIIAVEWTRPDLEHPEYVLYYSDGHLDPTHQHPSFKDRVELVDRDLKDGDVSLILKNVNRHDAGTYECRVAPAGSRRKKRSVIDSEPIRIIRLQVPDSAGSNSGHSKDGNSSHVGLLLGLAAGVLVVLVLVAAAVGGVLIYRRHKNKTSGPPAADDDEASADKFI